MSVDKGYVQSGKVALDTNFLSTEEREWIVDELAPAAKRGKKSKDFPDGFIKVSGTVMTEVEEYENVRITYYSKNTGTGQADVMEATAILITWKNRPCKQQSNNPPFKIAITAESPTVVAGSDVWIKV
ncbi:MAG: hypothetical protein M3362_22380, partial [Acidobacteriota bacterium]|nr:hypothetical protein [Acidobacteriota bacterium]